MDPVNLVRWALYAVTSILISYMVFADLRYTFRKRRSASWPVTGARIDGGVVGFRGPLSGLPRVLYRVHFTYSYQVRGSLHHGSFCLLAGSQTEGDELRQTLVGRSVPIKYDDRKPQVALLMDAALAGKRIMQGPSWTCR